MGKEIFKRFDTWSHFQPTLKKFDVYLDIPKLLNIRTHHNTQEHRLILHLLHNSQTIQLSSLQTFSESGTFSRSKDGNSTGLPRAQILTQK